MSARKQRAPAKRPIATRDRILDVAEALMQTRGFNGFSYADVAKEIGIATASLHHHFPSKAGLGAAVLERYDARNTRQLEAIDVGALGMPQCLARYAELYARELARKRLCLGAMLAAEFDTLPAAMQKTIGAFFHTDQRWLEGLIAGARAAGQLPLGGSNRDAATLVVCALEGAMLISRPLADNTLLAAVLGQLLVSLQGPR